MEESPAHSTRRSRGYDKRAPRPSFTPNWGKAPTPEEDEFEDIRYDPELDGPSRNLPPTNPWVNYILSGEVPDVKIELDVIKKALVELAGSPHLVEGTKVMERYRQLQLAASGRKENMPERNGDENKKTDKEKAEDTRSSNGAECNGHDQALFFPERGMSTRPAKRICLSCAIRQECVEAAIDSSERFGILGGLSERQRRKARRTKAKQGPEAMQKQIEKMWSVEAKNIDDAIRAGRLQ